MRERRVVVSKELLNGSKQSLTTLRIHYCMYLVDFVGPNLGGATSSSLRVFLFQVVNEISTSMLLFDVTAEHGERIVLVVFFSCLVKLARLHREICPLVHVELMIPPRFATMIRGFLGVNSSIVSKRNAL